MTHFLKRFIITMLVLTFLVSPGTASEPQPEDEIQPKDCSMTQQMPARDDAVRHVREALRGCVQNPLGPLRSDCQIPQASETLEPWNIAPVLRVPLIVGTATWAVAAAVEAPCVDDVPVPVAPFYADTGITTPPFEVNWDGAVACKKKHIPLFPDRWEYSFTVTASIAPATYTGYGPWDLTASKVDFHVPSDSKSWFYSHSGFSKTVCKGNSASDVGVAQTRADNWIKAEIVEMGEIDISVKIFYLRTADGGYLYELPGEGVGFLNYEPVLDSGAWEWEVTASVVTSPHADILIQGKGSSVGVSPHPIGQHIESLLNDDPTEV